MDRTDAVRIVTTTSNNFDPSRPPALQTPGDSCNWIRCATSSRYKRRVDVVGVEDRGRTTKDGKLPKKGDRDGKKVIEKLSGMAASACEPGKAAKACEEQRYDKGDVKDDFAVHGNERILACI